jgi:pyrroline-5-carboxylate reductase
MLETEKEFQITGSSLKNLVKESQILVLGVRSDQMENLLKDLSQLEVQDKMILTMATGLSISFYQKYLGEGIQIARVMPNLAISVAEGVTIASFSKTSSREFRSTLQRIFGSMGILKEVGEEVFPFASSLSSSALVCVFQLLEAMAKLGEKEGIPYLDSLEISSQGFLGASRSILKGENPQELIHRMAAFQPSFNLLQEIGWEDLLQKVLLANTKPDK